MNNLNKHFKDRSPKETIQIVQNFFNNYNFSIKTTVNNQSESGTYFSRIELYKNNVFIIGANGKGMTELYSLASGFSELYERFCNKIFFLSNLTANKRISSIQPSNKDTRNFKDIIKQNSFLLEWAKPLFNDENSLIEYLKIITNNTPLQESYYEFNNFNNYFSLDSRILFKLTGSKGMVAGNNLEEALNQGLSELYETWVRDNIFLTPPTQLYALSDKVLQTLPIYNNIQKLKQLNYKIYICDLGYNYNAPVIMSILLNPYEYNIGYNIGAFPILDIAVERTITELYQGISSYKNIHDLQIPFKTLTPSNILINNCNSLSMFSFDEKLIKNIKIVDTPSKVFLNSNQNLTNKDINNYFIKLNQSHNFHFYYKNNSLIPEMTALQIFCPEIKSWESNYSQYKHMSNLYKQKFFKEIKDAYRLINNSNNISQFLINLNQVLNNINTVNRDGFLIGILLGGDSFSFYTNYPDNILIFDILSIYQNNNNLENLVLFSKHQIYKSYFTKFSFIQRYLKAGYSKQEIIDIYNLFPNTIPITEEDCDKCMDKEYLLQHIFLTPYTKYYNNEFIDLINIFFK